MWAKILLLFFVFSFLFRSDHSFDQDLGRHIKLGEIISQTSQIPKTNLFSYTNPDFPFINTHWLFEVIAYWFNQTVGLQALLILKIMIFLISVWLIIKIVPKENNSLLLPIGFIFLHVLRERLEFRPEIFSFLFTAATYYILEKYTRQTSSDRGTFVTKLIWSLPFIQLVWINTHIYFFVGLILQALFIIHMSYDYLRLHLKGVKLKILCIIFILSALVSLINPNGLTGLLYPLTVTNNYGYAIVENQTLFFLESIKFGDPNFLFVKIAWGIIVISLVITLIKRQFNIKNILLSIFGFSLSLINVRSFPYLVFLSLPASLQNFGSIKTNNITKLIIIIIIAVILILESVNYLNGNYYKSSDSQYQVGPKLSESAKSALDFVNMNDLPGPIFNNFDIGSYIIYRSYPRIKVFVDGRPEAYPKEFFPNVYIPIQADHAKFKQLEKQLGFQTIIFSHTDQTPWGSSFTSNIIKDPDWKLVFVDDFMVVFTKQKIITQKNLKELDLANLNPQEYKFENHVSYIRLGIFLLKTQNTKPAKLFFEKAAQIYPYSPILKPS